MLMLVNLGIKERALDFASKAHYGQVRKYTGEPYIEHCKAVADQVALWGGNDQMIAAAYLHDVIEDTECSCHEIYQNFGPVVEGYVIELTDQFTKQGYPQMNRAQRKRAECDRYRKQVSEEAAIIKWADVCDNTASIVRHDPKFAIVYLKEKAALLDALLPKIEQWKGW